MKLQFISNYVSFSGIKAYLQYKLDRAKERFIFFPPRIEFKAFSAFGSGDMMYAGFALWKIWSISGITQVFPLYS